MTTRQARPLPLWDRRPMAFAATLALLATGLAACLGLVLFLAGSLVLQVDLGIGHAVVLSLPNDLLSRGPGGWATLMALAGAAGAPLVGLAVFVSLYYGRRHAD